MATIGKRSGARSDYGAPSPSLPLVPAKAGTQFFFLFGPGFPLARERAESVAAHASRRLAFCFAKGRRATQGITRAWRNGRRKGLKIPRGYSRAGSSPA